MKIKWVPAILALLLACCTGCSTIGNRELQAEQEGHAFIGYFLNANDYIVPVELSSNQAITPQLAMDALAGKNAGVMEQLEPLELLPPIQESVTYELSIEGQKATVNLNGFSPANGNREYATILCIADTLLDTKAVQEVCFTFYGKGLEQLPFGTDVSQPFTEIRYLSETASASKIASSINLYFIDADGGQHVPVTRYITDKPTLEEVMNQFIAGPEQGTNLVNGLPANVKVLGTKMENGTATIHFSSELDNLMEQPDREEAVKKAIALCCKNFPEVHTVIIMVEGREVATYQLDE